MGDHFLLRYSLHICFTANSSLLHFCLEGLYVNTLTSLSTLQRLVVELANRIRKQNPSVASTPITSQPSLYEGQRLHNPVFPRLLSLKYWQEQQSDYEFAELQYQALAQFKLSKISNTYNKRNLDSASDGLAEINSFMSGNFPDFSSTEDRKEANGY